MGTRAKKMIQRASLKTDTKCKQFFILEITGLSLWQISRKIPFLKNLQNKLHLLIDKYYKSCQRSE